MIELLVLVVMAVAAVRSANALRRDKALFTEFQVSMQLIPLIYLFPLGPIAYLLVSAFTGSLPVACLLSVAVLVPGVLAVRKAAAAFERSGTSRTQAAQESLSIAFITGVGGVAYALLATIVRLLLNITAPVG